MDFLKNNKKFITLLSILFYSCSTSLSYKVTRTLGRRTEIHVAPDRISMVCGDASGDEKVYVFIIYILDDSNTVVEVIHSNLANKEVCNGRVNRIKKIISNGKDIYIAGMGNLNEPIKMNDQKIQFSDGKYYPINGRSLQLMNVANENGNCYGAFSGDTLPCPDQIEFPIKDGDTLP